jgi:lysozyme family protein
VARKASNTVGLITDDEIINRILQAEGSTYTDDPDDAGGPTKFGITLATLAAWRGTRCTADDVKALGLLEAIEIYRAHYVAPFEGLRSYSPAILSLRVNVIDMGVNAGVVRAIRLLQQLAGVVVDGKIGAKTIAALDALAEPNLLFVGVRLAYYENVIAAKPSQIKYRRGWRTRALSFAVVEQPRALGASRRRAHHGKAYDDSKLRTVSRSTLARTRDAGKGTRARK